MMDITPDFTPLFVLWSLMMTLGFSPVVVMIVLLPGTLLILGNRSSVLP